VRVRLLQLVAIAALAAAALLIPATASAAPPGNDGFASATDIDPSTLPFSDSLPIDEATLEVGEPQGCYVAGKTVWYTITPTTNEVIRADIGGSSFGDRILYVYRQDGSGLGGLSTVGCASPYYNGLSAVTFNAEAGKTYYLQAGGFFSWTTGTLNLSVQAIPPPPNDNFGSATTVDSLPFFNTVDAGGATVESGEPTPSCNYGQSPGTVWYAFTPSRSGSYSASAGGNAQVAVYTGGHLDSLSQIGCRAFGTPLTFHADAGTTYYFQLGGLSSERGTVSLSLDVAPPPVVSFFSTPGDPSIYDTIQFFDQSYDPAQVGISSESWSFGDGSSASGCCPTHRYSADGTYTVRLTVTTSDGRTASTSRDLLVKTHDVSVARVTAPQTARVGQTRAISVGLTNRRYPETVQVVLSKSVAGGGWQQVGVLTQYVPVRGGGRTTDFSFNYTFAPEDAQVGKINFQAVAVIQGERDALPNDNTFISLATKVTS
jgi:PKD repeat protein